MEIKTLDKLKPGIAIIRSILNTNDLVTKGFTPTMQDLLLPSLISSFVPPLIANGVTKKFEIVPKDVLVYFVGFFLSLYLYSNRYLIPAIKYLPRMYKAYTSIKLVESKDFTTETLAWQITSEFVGIAVNKTILKKRLRLKPLELFSIISCNCGLYLIKELDLPSASAILVVYFTPMYEKLSEFIELRMKARELRNNHKIGVLNTPLKRMPRRKASVANIIEKKNK